jgi:competence protein ComEC
LFSVAFCLPKSYIHITAYVKSFTILFVWLILGSVTQHLQYTIPAEKAQAQLSKTPDCLIVAILEAPQKRKNSLRTIAALEWQLKNQALTVASGKCWLYFPKDDQYNFLPGTQLLIKKAPTAIAANQNPGSFNFQLYSKRQQIYSSIYLTDKDFRLLQKPASDSWHLMLHHCRQYVLQQLENYIPNKESLGIAQALLIGYRAELDKEILQAYSDTGLVHIIAISGMHLGMIYGLCMLLLGWMDKLSLKWVKTIIILCIIWGFTLITGAGPSITRAAVMFSCLLLGNMLQRKTEPINNLAAAALLLLLYDPNMLYDVGFQLSFAAVLSIMIFYPMIFRWFWCSNQLIKYLWSLIAVTLAAQILTTPIAIYHFHQFPNYFLFANLIAIPLSGLILYAEIALIIIAQWKIAAQPLATGIDACIQFMNTITERIAALPGALTDHINLSIPMLILGYLFIASTTAWLMYKRDAYRWATIVSLSCILVLHAYNQRKHQQQFQLIVCNLPKIGLAMVTEGQQFSLIGDSTVWQDAQLYQQYVRPIRTYYQVRPGKLPSVRWEHNLLSSSTKSVVFVHQAKLNNPPAKPQKIDALIITGNPKLYIKELMQIFSPEVIVFDSSNPQWKINYWKKDCDKLHLRHHSVPEKGAFVMDL